MVPSSSSPTPSSPTPSSPTPSSPGQASFPGYPDLGPEPVAEIRIVTAEAVPTAVIRVDGVPMATIGGLFDSAFGTAFPALFAKGIQPAGPAMALYSRITGGPESEADVEIGFPLARPLTELLEDGSLEADGLRIVPSELPAGDVAVVSHVGGYDGLGEAWGRTMGEIAGMGREPEMPCWEFYVTEPTPDADPATMRTDLYCRVGAPTDAA